MAVILDFVYARSIPPWGDILVYGRSYGRGASGSITSFEMPGSDSLVRGTPCTLGGIVIELLDVDILFEGMVIQN